MRDIRSDLKERLHALKAERGRLEASLDDLKAEEEHVQALLDAENKRYHNQAGERRALVFHPTSQRVGEFVLDALKKGGKWNIVGLKRYAESIGFAVEDGVALGRSLQGALMGLKNQGLVENVGPGEWEATNKEAPSD